MPKVVKVERKNKKQLLIKEKLKKLILANTEYWLPYGKYDKKRGSCFIIEEKEPFFWRINPEWAEELAEKITEFLNTVL
jgi:hypothetical protein